MTNHLQWVEIATYLGGAFRAQACPNALLLHLEPKTTSLGWQLTIAPVAS